MKKESSTDTPEKQGHIGGETKVESCGLIVYQWNSKKTNFLKTVYLKGSVYLKGERIISSANVRIPKYEVPSLAENEKKRDTSKIDRKINVQDGRSNSFRRFQMGGTFAGYLVNQYSGK